MRKLVLATLFVSAMGCSAARAGPAQTMPPNFLPLKSRMENVLDMHSLQSGNLVLFKDRMEFKRNPEDAGTDVPFDRNAVAGRFMSRNEAMVLFKDGELERLRFTENEGVKRNYIKLFKTMPVKPPKLFIAGRTVWIVVPESSKAIKVVWSKNNEFTVDDLHFEAGENAAIKCSRESCKAYMGPKLIGETKEK